MDLCSERESIGVARAACFEILVASVRECVQTGTHAHDLLQYDGLFDTVGASLKAFPYPRLFFQWYIQPTFSVDSFVSYQCEKIPRNKKYSRQISSSSGIPKYHLLSPLSGKITISQSLPASIMSPDL